MMSLSRATLMTSPRARTHRAGIVTLAMALAAVALALLPAAPAQAASSPAFVCEADTVYSIDGGSHVITKIKPSTGGTTANGTISVGNDTLNALALPNGGGRYIYAFNRSQNEVVRFDANTNGDTSYSLASNDSAGSVIAGAINPVDGLYYYAVGGDTWKLYAFNTSSNTGIGQVGTISGLGSNGDMAFDALGNLYVVSNANSTAAGTLARVNAPLPTTAGTTALNSTVLASLPGSSGRYASMAFDGSGYLFVGTDSGKLIKVNPTSGAQVSSQTLSLTLSDMASCSSPSTATTRVDLPQGRHDSADQFTVTITGNGVTTGNTGTTTGIDSGVQSGAAEMAGPVVVLPSTTYTITQTAAGGTDFNDYTTTWKCVDQNTGSQIANGSGNSGSFTVPSTAGSSVICTFTNLPLLPAIDLVKTAGAINDLDGNGPDAGDTVSYTFKVTNTGNIALTSVGITDTKLGTVTCGASSLAVGASTTCTAAAYVLTQADVTAGSVANTATATGTGSNGVKVTDPDTVTVTIPANPSILLDKTASTISDLDANGPDVGDTITFGFTVKNTGNVPLTSVGVNDPKLGGAITCPKTTLAPAELMTCTSKTYTLTQDDVNTGKVVNTATATGTPPTGANVTSTDSTTTTVPATPAITVDKTAGALVDNDSNGTDVGDTIAYTFVVKNTGNVTLTSVALSDPMFGGAITCPKTTLAPAESMTCTGKTYTLTQADVNAGKVVNTATVTGTPPTGSNVSGSDSTTTAFAGTAAIDLVKTAGAITDVDGNGADAGDTITYSFKVTNIGTVTLTSVAAADPLFSPAGITCPKSTLVPAESMTCTNKTYTLTQANVDAGKVTNTATAAGTPPTGPTVTDDSSTTTPVPAAPSIDLKKTAGAITDTDHNGPDAGDTITYTFKVTNTGNVTLNPVTVADAKVGPVTCPSGALAPGASVDCTAAAYALTQADVNAGKVDNAATATGTAPSGTKVTDDDSTSTPIAAGPSITLVKTAGAIVDTDGNGDDKGDTITYTFKVTNTGNVTLNPVKVTDLKVGTVTCPSGALAPGASVDCTAAAYVVTQADVDAGKVDNTATASGTPPTGSPVTDTDSTHTPITQKASIDLVKSAGNVYDVNGNGLDDGDTVTYNFTVTNTGTVTLTNINVSDAKVGPVTCPSGSLAPGASVQCDPRTYTLTQADIDAGSVVNHATVTGTAPNGSTVTDDDSRTVDLPATGAIQLVKTAGALVDTDGNGSDAGDTITYSFRVTNVGNVKLDPVTVSDPKVGPVTCPTGGLEPDESFTCTDVVYVITAADVSAGKVDNTATATGKTPTGGTVESTDSTHTVVQPSVTNVKVTKTVDNPTPHVGDTVTYTLSVTNTGAADAKDVVITDALPTGVTFVSADAACTRTGSVVRCEIGTVPAGATRDFEVRVTVDPLPAVGSDHQHLFDVQKTEVQVDLQAGETVSATASCMDGYVVTDGSGRVDHVDQGTGTLADVHMIASHSVGDGAWKATFVNSSTGHAAGKVFAVCVKSESEVVNGHSHHLVVGDLVSQTVSLPSGTSDVSLQCAAGQTPIQPGYELDGVAPVITTYPNDSLGWDFRVNNPASGGATQGTFTIRCLDNLVSDANGHTHALGLNEVRKTVTVPAGQTTQAQLTCANDAKGIVAGYDLDPGLVMLGNDPQPITRVFYLYNPTDGPLSADLYLLCLSNRTTKGAQGGTIVNTANVSTSTPETTTGDNSSSATIQVSAVATPVAPRVSVGSSQVTTAVRCGTGAGTCRGTATLLVRHTVLAKGSYAIKAGKTATLHLRQTKAGRHLLSTGLKRAQLRLGTTTRTVRIQH